MDSVSDIFQENIQHLFPNVDYECLRKYNENNEDFSMAIILENQEGEDQQRAIGYSCIYRYGKNKIKLEYYFENLTWNEIPLESCEEQEILFDFLFPSDDYHIQSLFQSLTLEQQIQIIIKRYNKHFSEIDKISNQEKFENNKNALSTSIFAEEISNKSVNNDLIELCLLENSQPIRKPKDYEQLKSIDHVEKDFVDYGFHSLINGSRSKFHNLAPPPVAPRRSRQNSAFSQCSVRYATFIPPPTAPIRQRRVIESIHISVKRKKKLFERIVDFLKRTKRTTMYELGLEFLRVYDGKFNYRVGYEFDMIFQKKSWSLTIEKIQCVDCPAGEMGPRSLLVLSYKDQHTNVQV